LGSRTLARVIGGSFKGMCLIGLILDIKTLAFKCKDA